MAACKIDADASPHFSKMREYWKNHGYPNIDADLAEAFANIRKDIQANHARRVPGFGDILKEYELYKYRQKNRLAREGASGGWRIYALFDRRTTTLYPLLYIPRRPWRTLTTIR
ncbi:MAG: hypothetical protein ACE14L_14995 [Terriglobales bacterium]